MAHLIARKAEGTELRAIKSTKAVIDAHGPSQRFQEGIEGQIAISALPHILEAIEGTVEALDKRVDIDSRGQGLPLLPDHGAPAALTLA